MNIEWLSITRWVCHKVLQEIYWFLYLIRASFMFTLVWIISYCQPWCRLIAFFCNLFCFDILGRELYMWRPMSSVHLTDWVIVLNPTGFQLSKGIVSLGLFTPFMSRWRGHHGWHIFQTFTHTVSQVDPLPQNSCAKRVFCTPCTEWWEMTLIPTNTFLRFCKLQKSIAWWASSVHISCRSDGGVSHSYTVVMVKHIGKVRIQKLRYFVLERYRCFRWLVFTDNFLLLENVHRMKNTKNNIYAD